MGSPSYPLKPVDVDQVNDFETGIGVVVGCYQVGAKFYAIGTANYGLGLGANLGVYESLDGMATWTQINDPTDPLALFPKAGWIDVTAGTGGALVFIIGTGGGGAAPYAVTSFDLATHAYSVHAASTGFPSANLPNFLVGRDSNNLVLFSVRNAPIYRKVFTWNNVGGWDVGQDFAIFGIGDIFVEPGGRVWAVNESSIGGAGTRGTWNMLDAGNTVLNATLTQLPGITTTGKTFSIWVGSDNIVRVSGNPLWDNPPGKITVWSGTPLNAPVFTPVDIFIPDGIVESSALDSFGREVDGVSTVLFGVQSVAHGGVGDADRLFLSKFNGVGWDNTFFYDGFANPPTVINRGTFTFPVVPGLHMGIAIFGFNPGTGQLSMDITNNWGWLPFTATPPPGAGAKFRVTVLKPQSIFAGDK